MPGLSTHEELILLRKRARRRLVGAIVLVMASTVVLWKVVGSVPEQQMKPESVEIVGQKAPEVAPASAPVADAVLAASEEGAAPVGRVASASASATQLPAKLEDAPVLPPAQAPKALTEANPAAQPRPKTEPKPVAKLVQPEENRPEPKKVIKEEPKPHPKAEAKAKAESESKRAEAPAPTQKKTDPAAILEGRAEAEPAKSVARSESAAAASGNGNVVIQLAALSDPAKADALKSRLSALGVNAHFSKVETSKGNVTRVRVGPFGSRDAAETVLKKLSNAGVTGIIVSR